jgi:preprotein translocase subunit SecE
MARADASEEPADEEHDVSPVAPTQLGARRFVYAAYFAGAIALAFIASKALDFAWMKLQNYQPAIGEPRDEIVMPLAGAIGAGAAVYYWYRTRARQLAEEVAAEMSKVTWPSRAEVTNGTVVVIVTTVVSTVFFALMDKFWGFVTNLVYGGT